ncbi:hypothetical protein ADE_49140 [Achromobacter denitrificans]|nr:hypothetical protein ADE_49140 [Achromobacter denitrificans]
MLPNFLYRMMGSFQAAAGGLPAGFGTVCVRARARALLDTVRFLPDPAAMFRPRGGGAHSSDFFARFSAPWLGADRHRPAWAYTGNRLILCCLDGPRAPRGPPPECPPCH